MRNKLHWYYFTCFSNPWDGQSSSVISTLGIRKLSLQGWLTRGHRACARYNNLLNASPSLKEYSDHYCFLEKIRCKPPILSLQTGMFEFIFNFTCGLWILVTVLQRIRWHRKQTESSSVCRLRTRSPQRKSQSCHFHAGWPGASCLTSLCLLFHYFKTEIKPHLLGFERKVLDELIYEKLL